MGTTQLSDYERGRAVPKVDKLLKIAEVAGTSLDWIVTGKDPAPPPRWNGQPRRRTDQPPLGDAIVMVEQLLADIPPRRAARVLDLLGKLRDVLRDQGGRAAGRRGRK